MSVVHPLRDDEALDRLGPANLTVLNQHEVLFNGLDAAGIQGLWVTDGRRTKALHILLGTGDLETVRVLLGHTKIESTARYLRIAKRSDPIAISRAFDI
jgi:hypothetical protein